MPGPRFRIAAGEKERQSGASWVQGRGSPAAGTCRDRSSLQAPPAPTLDHPPHGSLQPMTRDPPSPALGPSGFHPAGVCSTLIPKVPAQHPPVAPAVSPGFPSHPPAPELMTHPQHGHLFVLVSDRLMFLMAHNHFSEVI